MDIIEAQQLHKTYHRLSHQVDVLKGVDFKAEQGRIIAVVGPSGAGKSTLLHILGGLDRPTQGKVLIQGKDVYDLKDHERAQLRNTLIGFVFQFYHLLPEFTALENVMLPGIIKTDKTQSKELEDKGLALLAQVGLTQRAQHKPYQMSGGEQQRTALARALMNDPAIVLCDEPTGNLDSQSGRDVIELIGRLNNEKKQTFIIVTHDKDIAKMAHRTFFMRDGKLNE